MPPLSACLSLPAASCPACHRPALGCPLPPAACSTPSVMERLNSLQLKFEARQKLQGLKNDMLVLKNIWFKKLQVGGKAARLWMHRNAAACRVD